jgi:eukaryotic-like serine/threonine-protein kinase
MPAEQNKDGPVFERYGVVQSLRSGPITDLYRAELTALKRPVFIKALARGISPSSPFAAALEREAKLLMELDHPSILRALDFVHDEASMWLVLEYVDGWTLEAVLEKGKKLSPALASAIAMQLAEALGHAHKRGVVHRDVRPVNVLISKDGTVKIANFAAAADERLPTAPELLDGRAGFGTPAYMSPEQVLGEPEDPRSDIFSLGIVLFEMLTGRRPFDAPDERAVSHRIRHDQAVPVGKVAPAVSGSLDRIVRRCLEKMPADRFANAGELARALGVELDAEGSDPAAAVVASELARLGLVSSRDESRRDSVRVAARKRQPMVSDAALVYITCLVLIVAGGAAIQYSGGKAPGARAPRTGAHLDLVPKHAGYLRVVADPWALVVVDGQQVDTTPFARPIPLSPGIHYVRLEHPHAKTERRTVSLSPGETVLLDVKMDVARPKVQKADGVVRPTFTDPKTP